MIYNDRERLGISILLSLILCMALFLVFDYLADIDLLTPKVIRPPLIVSFYAEKPAPLGEETKEEPIVKSAPPPKPKKATQQRSQTTERQSTSTQSTQKKVTHDNTATDYVPDIPPVEWGDETKTNESYIPKENKIDYGENAPVDDSPSEPVSAPEIEIVETSQYSERLAKIEDKTVTGESGSAGSSADSDGTNPSSIYSDSPVSLDTITSQRKLQTSPRPKLPENFNLEGKSELIVDVYFEITWSGTVTNLKFLTNTGYPVLEEAIRDALMRWRFVAAARNTPNMKVRMGYRVRAR